MTEREKSEEGPLILDILCHVQKITGIRQRQQPVGVDLGGAVA